MVQTDLFGPSWSEYQRAIFHEVRTGAAHVFVDALAGTGKTTTIEEAFALVPKGASVLALAFGKDIEVELAKRIKRRGLDVEARTLNGHGYRAVRRAMPKCVFAKDRSYEKIKHGFEKRGETRAPNHLSILNDVVSKAKGWLAHEVEDIEWVIDRYNIDVPRDARRGVVADAIDVLTWQREDPSITYDDQIWLPNVLQLNVDRYDYVFIDESQDMNRAQTEIALRSIRDGGRIIAVGDERQAIYGFRGADPGAVQRIKERLLAKTLSLPVSYRCARAIVDLAREYVPAFRAAPNARPGLVEEIARENLLPMVRGGDFVLSRANAPLVSLCLLCLAEGRPARIAGRDIGLSLVRLLHQLDSKQTNDLRLTLKKLRDYEDDEEIRLLSHEPPRSTDALHDKCRCIRILSIGKSTVEEACEHIRALFADRTDEDTIVFSSTHKAKGLERQRVFMLRETYLRKTKRPRTVEQQQEEENLFYVAVTRAKDELYLVRAPEDPTVDDADQA